MILTEIDNTAEAWSLRADREAESWRACGWSRESQAARFAAILGELDLRRDATLLDWGCGTGALTEYLPSDIHYTGYDRSNGMVARATREHPEQHFQNWEPWGVFDYVVCIGPFNLPGGWSKQMTWFTLRRLFERARVALAVSLYAGTDERCLVYTIEECAAFAGGQSFQSTVHLWRDNDILMVLRK